MAELPFHNKPDGGQDNARARAQARRTRIALLAAAGLYGLAIASFGQLFFPASPSLPFWMGLALMLGAGVGAAVVLGAMRQR